MNASNIKPALDALRKEVRTLGEQSGLGRDVREKFAIALARAAYQGVITVDPKNNVDDVPDLVDDFLTSESKKLIHNHSSNGRKVMESKCRQIVLVSAVEAYDFPDTLERAVDIRKELRKDEANKIKPAFEAYVQLSRDTKEAKRKLSDDEIRNAMLSPVKKDKSDLDRMCDEYIRIRKLADGNENTAPIPEMQPVVEAMASAIEQAGGELPPVTKEEKKAAEAVAFLRSQGMLAAA